MVSSLKMACTAGCACQFKSKYYDKKANPVENGASSMRSSPCDIAWYSGHNSTKLVAISHTGGMRRIFLPLWKYSIHWSELFRQITRRDIRRFATKGDFHCTGRSNEYSVNSQKRYIPGLQLPSAHVVSAHAPVVTSQPMPSPQSHSCLQSAPQLPVAQAAIIVSRSVTSNSNGHHKWSNIATRCDVKWNFELPPTKLIHVQKYSLQIIWWRRKTAPVQSDQRLKWKMWSLMRGRPKSVTGDLWWTWSNSKKHSCSSRQA